MAHACFDSDGFLLWMVRKGYSLSMVPPADSTVMEVDANADPNTLFFDGENVVQRALISVTADRSVIVADGADGAEITGLPDLCWLKVNGKRAKIVGGMFLAQSANPAIIHIEAVGPHKSTIAIRADTAAALLDEVRMERDRRLLASDWTQMPDARLGVSTKTAWGDYRQSLRDLPETQPSCTIETVSWPSPPAK